MAHSATEIKAVNLNGLKFLYFRHFVPFSVFARVGFPKTRRLALGQSIQLNTLISSRLNPWASPLLLHKDRQSPNMSLMRTIRNIREGGIKEWFRQMT